MLAWGWDTGCSGRDTTEFRLELRGQGGLACDVCGDDALALAGGRGVEYAALHFGGKLRVNGIHVELRHQLAEALQTLVKERAG